MVSENSHTCSKFRLRAYVCHSGATHVIKQFRLTGLILFYITILLKYLKAMRRCKRRLTFYSPIVFFISSVILLSSIQRPTIVSNQYQKGPSNERQQKVVDAFQHAWRGYKNYAWGHDHLKPISKSFDDGLHLGLTIVDSLDTMFIMNLHNGKTRFKFYFRQTLSYSFLFIQTFFCCRIS